jgi:lipid-binding SYLF domain-containing protein
MADKMMGKPVKDLIKKAKGVFIAPEVLRGAFIVGVSRGSGVLVVRDPAAGQLTARYSVLIILAAKRASASRRGRTSRKWCSSS